jgi:hypothetical protein
MENGNMENGNRKRVTGSRKGDTEDGKRKHGEWKQETGDRKQERGHGGWKTENRRTGSGKQETGSEFFLPGLD